LAESGIGSADHIQRMAGAGVKAVLVGEALIRSGTPAETISEWLAAARGR
jgi:indole-3-glycerol phosphate synthase